MPKEQVHPWVIFARDALLKWFEQHKRELNMRDVHELRDWLGIPPNVWNAIRQAKQVVETHPEYYAMLFELTGLSELDPRTIPPRERITGDVKNQENRAWSNAEYQNWKKTYTRPQVLSMRGPHVVQQAKPNVPQQNPIPTNEVLEVLADLVAQRLKVTPSSSQQDSDTEALLVEVENLLQSVRNGGEQELEAFVEKYGKTRLGKIYALLTYLLSNEKERQEQDRLSRGRL